jgi:hypothetical protein
MLSLIPAVTEAAGKPRRAARPLARNEPLKLALLANGKPNSAELLDAMARHLREHLPIAEVRSWRKASVSVPPSNTQVAEITEWAHAVLAAVGD